MSFPAALSIRLVGAELAPGALERELSKMEGSAPNGTPGTGSGPNSFVSGINTELVTVGSLAGMSRTGGIALGARLAPHGIVRSRRPLLVAAMPWNRTFGNADSGSPGSDNKNDDNAANSPGSPAWHRYSRTSDAQVFVVETEGPDRTHPYSADYTAKWSLGSISTGKRTNSFRGARALLGSSKTAQSPSPSSSAAPASNSLAPSSAASGGGWASAKVSVKADSQAANSAAPSSSSNDSLSTRISDASLFIEVHHVSTNAAGDMESSTLGSATIPLFWLLDEKEHTEWIVLTSTGELALPESILRSQNPVPFAEAGSPNARLVEHIKTLKSALPGPRVKLEFQYLWTKNTDVAARPVVEDSKGPLSRMLTLLEDGFRAGADLKSYGNDPRPRIPLALLAVVDSAEADKLANALVGTFDFHSRALDLMKLVIEEEVFRVCATAQNPAGVLFRGNSIAVKMASRHARRVGQSYLDRVITPAIREVITDSRSCEIDPAKLPPDTPAATLSANQKLLRAFSEKFLATVIDSLDQIPFAIRAMCQYFRSAVEIAARSSPQLSADYWRTAVGGFFFLRFICPAISTSDIAASELQRRPLILATKCLQNLASGVGFADGKKEAWMSPMDDFISENRVRVDRFFHTLTAAALPTSTDDSAIPSPLVCAKEMQTLCKIIQGRRSQLEDKLPQEVTSQLDILLPQVEQEPLFKTFASPPPFGVPADFLRSQGSVQLSFEYDPKKGHPIGLPPPSREQPLDSGKLGKKKVKKQKLNVVVLNDAGAPKSAGRRKVGGIISLKMSKADLHQVSQESPALISIELAARFFALYNRYSFERRLRDTGTRELSTKWNDVRHSSEFGRACTVARRLKIAFQAKKEIPPESHRKAMFLNIFNASVLHACIHESKTWEQLVDEHSLENVLQSYAYDLGGIKFTMAEMLHGVLRCNQGEPGSLGHLSASQEGWSLSTPVDRLIHFAITYQTRSCPAFQVYHPDTLGEQLIKAASCYLNQQVRVSTTKHMVYLPPLFGEFATDFVLSATSRDANAQKKATLTWLYPHLTNERRAEVAAVLARDDNIVAAGSSGSQLVSIDQRTWTPQAPNAGKFLTLFTKETPGVEDPGLVAFKQGNLRVILFQLEPPAETQLSRGTIVLTGAQDQEQDELPDASAVEAESESETARVLKLIAVVERSHIQQLREIRAMKLEIESSTHGLEPQVRQQFLIMFAQILKHLLSVVDSAAEFLSNPESQESAFEPPTFTPSYHVLQADYNPDTVARLEAQLSPMCDLVATHILDFKREFWHPFQDQPESDATLEGLVIVGICFRSCRYALQFRQFQVE